LNAHAVYGTEKNNADAPVAAAGGMQQQVLAHHLDDGGRQHL
jgi:hypothetical protein